MERIQPDGAERAFFATSHWGCLVFLAVLAIAAAGSAARLLRLGEITTYDGIARDVEILQPSTRQASYRVSLESDGGELLSLRLLNQGRIRAYLQSAPSGQRVQVEVRDGVVRRLTLRERDETITERQAPRLLLVTAVLLPVLLLATFALPAVQARGARSVQQLARRDEEEE